MALFTSRGRLWIPVCALMVGMPAVSCGPSYLSGVRDGPPWMIPPAADPETNPGAFVRFAAAPARGWGSGGDRQQRNCRDCPAGTYTDVQVDAVGGMASYSPGPAGDRRALVARFINRGNQVEDKYGLSGRPDTLHYLVLDPRDAAGFVRWRVWSVRGNTAVAGTSGSFRRCHPDKANHPDLPANARAKFLDCDMPRDVPGGGELAAMLLPRSADTWLECEKAGCCFASTVSAPY